MVYQQLVTEERHKFAAMRILYLSVPEIAPAARQAAQTPRRAAALECSSPLELWQTRVAESGVWNRDGVEQGG